MGLTPDGYVLAVQAALTAFGFTFLIWQVSSAKYVARARLINDLSSELSQYEPVFTSIATRGDATAGADDASFTVHDVLRILTFFEKLGFLEDQHFIRIKHIDLLYRKRFFSSWMTLMYKVEFYKTRYIDLIFIYFSVSNESG